MKHITLFGITAEKELADKDIMSDLIKKVIKGYEEIPKKGENKRHFQQHQN